ncbi:Fmu (Sun) domain protein [Niabella ginsenosidivorans]|uniref:Fmu (Sun) domain protein n=1 Tax=Niabella ginsenosidivorans TaxID=1176587 RepID=A0A1A9HYY8_9BACT|nr:Fmu (Sun) domain protein [Niabella ginsenosidivorans]
MGRFHSYLKSAVKIISRYKGNEPLASFLKSYFSGNKKFGSNDRREITNLCYSYYRLGKAFTELSLEQQVLLGLKISARDPGPQWKALLPEYGVPEELQLEIFPWKEKLSAGINAAIFERSFLIQPDLFLRIRPGNEAQVLKKLNDALIPFEKEGSALRLPNAVKAGSVLSINTEVVVQDLSSQQLGRMLQHCHAAISSRWSPGQQSILSVWDCCAASGGKSILAVDALGAIDLTVSDIRPSIIANLKERFQEAGIKNYKAFVADATKGSEQLKKRSFDLVMADVPCSGSGTWSRTPEQLFYFDPEQIHTYTELQKSILRNIVHAVQPGGYLLYSTCSVFKAENEDQVRFLEASGFKLIQQQLITGYDKKADTLFGALLQKPRGINV